MIGKSEWFTRRKYLGWGIMPKVWQGWAYIIAIIIPTIVIQYAPLLDERSRTIALVVWALIMSADFIDIMLHMRPDERERIHEAFAERNAMWAMILVLIMGLAFQTSQSIAQNGQPSFDPVIIIALFVGLAVKAVTNLRLDRKD